MLETYFQLFLANQDWVFRILKENEQINIKNFKIEVGIANSKSGKP